MFYIIFGPYALEWLLQDDMLAKNIYTDLYKDIFSLFVATI